MKDKEIRQERSGWRTTPPAVFPVCLGFLGLALGWQNVGEIVPFAREISGVLLGLGSVFFLYFLALYLRKLAYRPSVLPEDLKSQPARAGIAAAPMSMMLLAAALLPYGISLPQLWWLGVIFQIGTIAAVFYAIRRDPPEQRTFNPFQYLTFVGPVVAPFAGIPLGYETVSIWLTYGALLAYAVITAGYGLRLLSERPPINLRPSLVIFLAPNCLFAISFDLIGLDWAALLYYWIANITAFVLIILTPWLLKAGWSPVWSALTFPLAAFVNVQARAVTDGAGILATGAVYVGLIVATPLILLITWRFLKLWFSGNLSEITGAAKA